MTTHINGMGYQVNATEDLTNAKFKVITLLGTIAQAAGPRAGASAAGTATSEIRNKRREVMPNASPAPP